MFASRKSYPIRSFERARSRPINPLGYGRSATRFGVGAARSGRNTTQSRMSATRHKLNLLTQGAVFARDVGAAGT